MRATFAPDPSPWVPSPDHLLGWVLDGAGALAPAAAWVAYMAGTVALTRRLLRRGPAFAIDDGHPMFHPPAWVGVHPWLLLNWLQLIALLLPAVLGFFLPQALAEGLLRPAYASGYGAVHLGLLGQLAQWVGGGCGLLIGLCRRDAVIASLVLGSIFAVALQA